MVITFYFQSIIYDVLTVETENMILTEWAFPYLFQLLLNYSLSCSFYIHHVGLENECVNSTLNIQFYICHLCINLIALVVCMSPENCCMVNFRVFILFLIVTKSVNVE
jgi:hypothetical protein